jgi:putative ABC transport system ATP-binding protein
MMAQASPVLTFRNISKSYSGANGPVHVLRGIDVDLFPGETLALTGESGSGKSTFLHIAGGLDVPDGGLVEVTGLDLSPLSDTQRARVRRENLAIVFQQFNLIPSLTVGDNIAFQARVAGRVDDTLLADLAERLSLANQLHKYPEDLSGGQQQRVAIARAIAARPKLLLADEPTGNLDEATAHQVLDALLALVADTGAALLLVTHSPKIAVRMNRHLHLSHGVLA